MNIPFKINKLIIYFFVIVGLCRCADPWDEHAHAYEGAASLPLLERLANEPEASRFLEILREVGMDSLLDGRNPYTLFVPHNASIMAAQLPENKEDRVAWISNHMLPATQRVNATADTVRLTMLNGKILDLVHQQIDGVVVDKSNIAGSDGLFHLISGVLPPRQNIWQYINDNLQQQQQAFVIRLNDYSLYDTAVLEDPEDLYLNNEFLRHVGDVRDEAKRFTYFVLNNTDFTAQTTEFLPYVYRNQPDSTYAISQFAIVKDLLFDQAYSPDELPDQLQSVSGVLFPVDRTAISQSIQLSNGWVHILSRSTLPLHHKLLDVVIQGEEPSSFSTTVNANTFIRVRREPMGGEFRDLMVQNHGISSLSVFYQLPRMYSTAYDVYWRALNDVQANVFQQRLGILEFDAQPSAEDPEVWVRNPILTFPYTDVALNDYSEHYLGEFTLTEYNRIVAALQSAATTANGNNTLVLDYIRFVPKPIHN